MDFLTTALYSEGPDGKEILSGALITRFEPDDITSRARVLFATTEQLRDSKTIHPSGFAIKEDGLLVSDAAARRAMNEYLVNYVGKQFEDVAVTPPPGLLDIILYGAKYGAFIVQNITELMGDKDGVEPIMVPMVNLRVSSSSFNVYAPYKNSEGFFRTLSLIDISSDQNYPFVMAIPEDSVEIFSPVLNRVAPYPEAPGVEGYRLFRVDLPLEPFYTFTGEAFCNYLAYNVAYYNMGLRVLKEFLQDTNYVLAKEGEPEPPRPGKTPWHNVSIECGYHETYTQAVLECIGNVDKLKALVRDNEEAYITFVWLQKIFQTADTLGIDDQEERLAAACASLQYDCRLQLLHHGIELLAQRYYLCQCGQLEDTMGVVLKGGGVNGSSIKRFVG